MTNALQVRLVLQISVVIQAIQINDLCFNTSAKLPFKCWIIQSLDKLFVSELQLSTAHFSQYTFKTVFFFPFYFFFFFNDYLTLSRLCQIVLRSVHFHPGPKRPLVNAVPQ